MSDVILKSNPRKGNFGKAGRKILFAAFKGGEKIAKVRIRAPRYKK